MSKFRDIPPPVQDETVVSFPAPNDNALASRKAELAASSRAAHVEMLLRLKYQMVLRALDVIETLEAVPDDWRAKLEAFEGLGTNAPLAPSGPLRDPPPPEGEDA